MQTILRGIEDIIYPNNCIICDNYIVDGTDNICKRCAAKFEPTWLENWIDKLRFKDDIDEVYSAWFATGSMNDLVHSMKYNNQPRLGEALGRRMANEIPINELGKIDILTAVPLNSTKKRERGYNQAEWICKGLAKVWNIPYQFDIIKRIKFTNTQTELPASDRKKNMENAFFSNKKIQVQTVAIIDDVITTGSTLSACAVVLKENGAKKIVGVSCCTPQFGI